MRAAAFIGLLLAASCVPAKKAEQSAAQGQPEAAHDEASPDIFGEWRIAALDGQPLRTFPAGSTGRPANVSIGNANSGAYSGCNSGGGTSVVTGGRLYLYGIMATAMGCGDLMDQENRIFSIMTSQPRIVMGDKGKAALESSKGTLSLEYTGPIPKDMWGETGKAAHPQVAGTRWNIYTIDGANLPRTQNKSSTLRFDAGQWTFAGSDCAPVGGRWTQSSADTFTLNHDGGNIPACAAAAVTALTNAPFTYRVGPNQEWIAANGAHWMAGERDRLAEADTTATMQGSWRLVSIEGADVATDGPAPTMIFGPGSYFVEDGCNRSEGLYVARGATLLVRASNVQTLARCEPDSAGQKLVATIASQTLVAFDGTDKMRLVSDDNELDFVRTNTPKRGHDGVGNNLPAGIKVRLDNGALLSVADARNFTLALTCGTAKGDWNNRRNPPQFSVGAWPDACANDPTTTRLNNIFSGPVEVRIGPNRDIILFVGDHGAMGGQITG